MSMFRGEKGDRVMASLCNPFIISVTGTPMSIHGDDLSFCSNLVKAFLNVVTECSTDIGGECLDIF